MKAGGPDMMNLRDWTTPDCCKVTMFLEEAARAEAVNGAPGVDEASRHILCGQIAAAVK